MLFGWRDEWSQAEAIAFVSVAQMFGGIAKDLTSSAARPVTKLVTPSEQSTRLFRLVSLLTGWKNSLKGVGYFLGSALIAVRYGARARLHDGARGDRAALRDLRPRPGLGTAKKKNSSLRDILDTNNPNLNYLSLARLFLFASRDFWFEVPLPFFLRSPPCAGLGAAACAADGDCAGGARCALDNATLGALDPFTGSGAAEGGGVCVNLNAGGGCGGLGWDRVVVGAILGAYIIVYGQLQSWTPQLVTGPLRQTPPNKLTEVLWGSSTARPPP